MSEKQVHAEIIDNYVVNAEVEGFEYTMDHSERNKDGESVGTSPTGFLVSAISGCYLMTAKSYFSRNDIEFTQLKVDIKGDFQNDKTNWKLIADITLQTDAKLNDKTLPRLIRFVKRNCTVSNVLNKGDNELNLEVELLD